MFLTIKSYLRNHKDADMAMLVEETGLQLEVIVEMIQDGRLILRDNPNLLYHCERCDLPIQIGRYCVPCSKELAADLTLASTQLRSQIDADKSKRGFYSR